MTPRIIGKPALPISAYRQRKDRTGYLVVHCSDTREHLDIGADIIREWHQKERGWIDIGYHFVIKRDGTIEIGRPVWSIGAGVMGHNSNSIHVCMVGGRGPKGEAENNFALPQFTSLMLLLAILEADAPGALVQGHRDFPDVGKACPSFDARGWWQRQRSEAHRMVAAL